MDLPRLGWCPSISLDSHSSPLKSQTPEPSVLFWLCTLQDLWGSLHGSLSFCTMELHSNLPSQVCKELQKPYLGPSYKKIVTSDTLHSHRGKGSGTSCRWRLATASVEVWNVHHAHRKIDSVPGSSSSQRIYKYSMLDHRISLPCGDKL